MSVLNTLHHTTPDSRAARHKQQTYERLKMATTAVLIEVGYQGLTIKGVTERADVGYGTFYMHFTDKDDAVWAVLHDLAERERKAIDARLAHIPFPKREYLSWVELFTFAANVREDFLSVFGSGGSTQLTQRYTDYLVQIHIDNMTRGTYSADHRDVDIEFLAQFIAGALMRLMLWWLQSPNTYTPEDMAEQIFRVVYRKAPPLGLSN